MTIKNILKDLDAQLSTLNKVPHVYKELKKIYKKYIFRCIKFAPSDHKYLIHNNIITWNLETKITFVRENRLGKFKNNVLNTINNYFPKFIPLDIDDSEFIKIKYEAILFKIKKLKNDYPNSRLYFQECDIELFNMISFENIYAYNKIIPRIHVQYILKKVKNQNPDQTLDNLKRKVADTYNELESEVISLTEEQSLDFFRNKGTIDMLVKKFNSIINEYFDEVDINTLEENYGVGLLSDTDFLIIPEQTNILFNSVYNGLFNRGVNRFSVTVRNCLIINFSKDVDNFKIENYVANCHSVPELNHNSGNITRHFIDINTFLNKEISKINIYVCGFEKAMLEGYDDQNGIINYIKDSIKTNFDEEDLFNPLLIAIRKILYSKCYNNIKIQYLKIKKELGVDCFDEFTKDFLLDYNKQHFQPDEFINKINNLDKLVVVGDLNRSKKTILEEFINQYFKSSNLNNFGVINEIISSDDGILDHIIYLEYNFKHFTTSYKLQSWLDVNYSNYLYHQPIMSNDISNVLVYDYHHSLEDYKKENIITYSNTLTSESYSTELSDENLLEYINNYFSNKLLYKFKEICEQNFGKKNIIILNNSDTKFRNSLWFNLNKNPYFSDFKFDFISKKLMFDFTNGKYNVFEADNGFSILTNFEQMIKPNDIIIIKNENTYIVNPKSYGIYYDYLSKPIEIHNFSSDNFIELNSSESNNSIDLIKDIDNQYSLIENEIDFDKEMFANNIKTLDDIVSITILVYDYVRSIIPRFVFTHNKRIHILTNIKNTYPIELKKYFYSFDDKTSNVITSNINEYKVSKITFS